MVLVDNDDDGTYLSTYFCIGVEVSAERYLVLPHSIVLPLLIPNQLNQ